MKRCAIALALISSMLTLAAVGFNGCGKGNTLTSITVTSVNPFIAKGSTRQMIVTAELSDGMHIFFWSQVTWQSSDTTFATVSSTGLVSGIKEGSAVITATDIAHPSLTSSITVYITDLQSITITPSLVSIPVGTVQTFTATGAYSGATTTWPPDLTPLVLWTSSSTTVALISNVTPSHGIATAVSAGTTTITATDLATGITGTATLTVL